MMHADAGDFGDGAGRFEEALAARERIGDDARTRVARWMVGWALRNLGRTRRGARGAAVAQGRAGRLGQEDPYVDEELALLEILTSPGATRR